jgi:hypothetical protein
MRMFLLSCLAVVAIGVGAYVALEGYLRESAGDAFAVPRSTRVSDSYKPDPRGFLSHIHAPSGGETSGRSTAGDERFPQQPTSGAAQPTR